MTITDTVHFLVLAYTFFAVVFYSRSKLHIEKKGNVIKQEKRTISIKKKSNLRNLKSLPP